MKRKIAIGFFLITALALVAPAKSAAGWNVSIAIPFPFPVYYYAPPAPVVVPAPVPYAYGYEAPVAWPMFYGGYWYRPSGGRWFMSAQFGGPWYGVGIQSVPQPVLRGPVHHGGPVYREAGRGHDGRYIPPRMIYEDNGRRGHGGRGHHDD